MKNLTATLCLTITLLLGSAGMSWSADLQKGAAAFKSGDYPTALREWKPLAEQGNATAQYLLGAMYNNGKGVPQDYKTAMKWYKLAAKQGDTNAQFQLGFMYSFGKGVRKDEKTAVKWYTLAAKQGNAGAQSSLGYMYEKGLDVPKDYKTAVKWYRLAAKQGDKRAQSNVDRLQKKIAQLEKNKKPSPTVTAKKSPKGDFKKGLDAYNKKDYATALREWKPLAEQGYSPAQYSLGLMYRKGQGVPQNHKTALKWYRLAAEQGHASAQGNLGFMYTKGYGVPQDYVRAHMWFNIAASSGKTKNASRNRDMVAKQLTPTQLVKAQDLARNFAPKKNSPVVTAKKSPSPTTKGNSNSDRVVSASSGSGFAVSSVGHVITNHHVIKGCQNVKIHHNGKSIKATVVTFDSRNDLALLKGDFRPSTVLSLSTKKPELLQDVYVAGFPFGRKVSTSVKVTKGIISSLTGMGNNFSNVQIDAALQSGNSGGPILDDKGNVVGVAVARLDKIKTLKKFGSLPENTNFGIKTSVVRTILESSNISLPKPNRSSISKSKLGKIISDATYYLSCWMTTAQIAKMRSQKVMFQSVD